jgi:hypothetical protein
LSPQKRYPLKWLWLHWTVAHAAGLGTFAGWIALYEASQLGLHAVRQNDSAFFIAGLLSILLGLAYLQQLILRSAGWPAPMWAVCTMLGLLAGCFVAAVFGDLAISLRNYSPLPLRVDLVLGALVGMFAGGCTLGAIQLLTASSDRRQFVVWIVGSGLAMAAATASQILFPQLPFLSPAERIPIFTIFGGCYGAITGGALVYLLAGERRHHGLGSLPGSE